jgi:hypothetical protein
MGRLLGVVGIVIALLVSASGAMAASVDQPAPVPAPGFKATVFANGMPAGAPGVSMLAFTPDGDVLVTDEIDGTVYRFTKSGGAAGATTTLGTKLGQVIGIAFSKDHQHLFVTERIGRNVLEIDPSDGHVIRTVAPNIGCTDALATDPDSGDLFVALSNCGPGAIMRIHDPAGAATVTKFADVNGVGFGMTFAPDGNLYVRDDEAAPGQPTLRSIARVDGPKSTTPGAVHPIVGLPFPSGVTVGAGEPGQPPVLLVNQTNGVVTKIDLSTTPPTLADIVTANGGLGSTALGPDGCLYLTQATAVAKITNADGSCPLRLRLAAAVSEPHQRSSLSAGLVAITNISLKAKDLARSAGVAAVLIVLVGFPAELFNSTLEENYDEVKRWFGPLSRGADSLGRSLGNLPGWLGVGAFAVVAALLTGLLDPRFGADLASASLFVGLLLSFLAVTYAFGWAERRYVTKRHGERPVLEVLPGTLVVAAVCVLVSRLAGFAPGYLYGVLAGFVFAAELTAAEEGRLTAWSSLVVLAGSLVAWVVWSPVGHMAAHADPSPVVIVLDTVLAGLFVTGIESLVFGLVPLRFLQGEKLFGWNRLVWVVVYALAMFAFVHVLLHPGVAYSESPKTNSWIVPVVAFAIFGGISVAFWALFRRRSGEPERDEALT